MAAHQQQRVLPSNGPASARDIGDEPLHDAAQASDSVICPNFNQGIDCRICDQQHICSTCHQADHCALQCRNHVLQASSGNITPHHIGVPQIDIKDPQYGLKPPSGYGSPPFHSAQAAIKQQKRRGGFPPMIPMYWDRCEQSSPRYRQYRAKQKANRNKDGKREIWTDKVEAAFQIALRQFAGRGRKKQELNGKQCGGNEFIAHWIWLLTKEKVSRKQVSSHIQVLKGFMHDVPEWMKLVRALGPDDRRRKGHHRHQSADDDDLPPMAELSNPPSNAYLSARPPNIDLMPPSSSQMPTIRSVKFNMELCDVPPKPTGQTAPAQPVVHHTYTSIQSEMPSAPRSLESIPDWHTLWPKFRPVDELGHAAPIFLFEAGLSLADTQLCNTQIRISFYVDFLMGNYYQDWYSKTQIKDEKGSTDVHIKRELEATHAADQTLNINIPFRAQYWVNLFHNISESKHRAKLSGDAQRIHEEEEYPRRFLGNVFVTQELWATPSPLLRGARPQRMAVLLWKFHQAGRNEVPTTSWRRLDLPPSMQPQASSGAQELSPPPVSDPYLGMEYTRQVPAFRGHPGSLFGHSPGIYPENPEPIAFGPQSLPPGNISPRSGMHIETNSLPTSATTRSFPLSATDSTFRSAPSHPGSRAPSATYTSMESLGSQDPMCHFDGPRPGPEDDETGSADHSIGTRGETVYHHHAPPPTPFGYQHYQGPYSHPPPMNEVSFMVPHEATPQNEMPMAFGDMPFDVTKHESRPAMEPPQEGRDEGPPPAPAPPPPGSVPIIAPKAQMANQYGILQMQHLDELQQQSYRMQGDPHAEHIDPKMQHHAPTSQQSQSQHQPQLPPPPPIRSADLHLHPHSQRPGVASGYVLPPQHSQGHEPNMFESYASHHHHHAMANGPPDHHGPSPAPLAPEGQAIAGSGPIHMPPTPSYWLENSQTPSNA